MGIAGRIAFRYLLSREMLGPSLDTIEKLIKEEKWQEARDAIQLFARKLGVSMAGTYEPATSVHTEWFGALDADDQRTFLSFIDLLRPIAEVVWPRAIKFPHVPEFEMMRIEAIFRHLKEDLPGIEEMRRDDTDAFKHGKFLIIPMKGITDTAEAVKTLDEVSGHIAGKFPDVLYGKVYVRKDVRRGSYESRPGGGGLIAGAYQAATDTIMLSMYATPDRNSMMTLIHEFGHRYHTRFLHGDAREKFIKLYKEGETVAFTQEERKKAAEEYIDLFRHHRDEDYPEPSTILSPRTNEYAELYPREMWKKLVSPWRKRFVEEKDDSAESELRRGIIYSVSSAPVEFPAVPEHLGQEKGVFASEYGRTSWEENFAESFLAFVLGKALPAPLEKFMRLLHK